MILDKNYCKTSNCGTVMQGMSARTYVFKLLVNYSKIVSGICLKTGSNSVMCACPSGRNSTREPFDVVSDCVKPDVACDLKCKFDGNPNVLIL